MTAALTRNVHFAVDPNSGRRTLTCPVRSRTPPRQPLKTQSRTLRSVALSPASPKLFNTPEHAPMPKALTEGSKAPAFKLDADGGGAVSLKDFAGQKLVLYFYPKDDTSGCTKEAIEFTAALAQFKKAGTAVIGVSKDTVAAHDKFKSKHNLKVQLASDPDGDMIESYGAWVEKSMYGKKYMGIDRSTFLIGGDGVIAKVWRKVKVPGHVDEVLAAAKAL
jgi:peroxiredoxin Q/BCP